MSIGYAAIGSIWFLGAVFQGLAREYVLAALYVCVGCLFVAQSLNGVAP